MTRILLVDDEPAYTQALIASLEARGYECLSAVNMTEAINVLRRTEVAALVTDIMMPPGSLMPHIDSNECGFQLIEYVQEHWPRLPMVCLSVIADQAKIRFLAKRGVRYLRKGETPLSTAIEVITAVAEGRRVKLRF